jgi:hypothetical protein
LQELEINGKIKMRLIIFNDYKAKLENKNPKTKVGSIILFFTGLGTFVIRVIALIANFGGEFIIFGISFSFLILGIFIFLNNELLIIDKAGGIITHYFNVIGLFKYKKKVWNIKDIKEIKTEEMSERSIYDDEIVDFTMMIFALKSNEDADVMRIKHGVEFDNCLKELRKFLKNGHYKEPKITKN